MHLVLCPPSQGWKTFLLNHADGIAAIDLFVAPTISFRLLYGLLIVGHGRRQILWFGVTSHPTAEWIANQFTEACGWELAPRYLIRDRDGAYGEVFIQRLRSMGIRDRPTSPRSPWQNGYAERLIGSIRRECVDHIVVLGERHLRHVLQSYMNYYNELRTHLSLEKDAPVPRAVGTVGRIFCRPVLGGLHHQYAPDLIYDRHNSVRRTSKYSYVLIVLIQTMIVPGNPLMNKALSANKQTFLLPQTIWYTRCPVPTASGIAIKNGWLKEAFAPDGIEVRSMRHSQDPKTRESHYTHTLDNSFRQGGNTPALFARSEGKDTVLLGLHWIPQYQAILSLPESGLTTIEQLRGRKLALPRRVNDAIDFWRATALQGYRNALRLGGLGLSDVELVDLPIERSYVEEDVEITDALTPAPRMSKLQTREMAALLRGEVDAIFGYSVWGAAVRSQISAIEIVNLSHYPSMHMQINNGAPETLTVSGRLLREHPELVERYVTHLVRAARWAGQNEDLARRAIAIETGSAEHWLDEGCGQDVAHRLAFSLDDELVKALETRKSFLLEFGFMTRDFDIREWMAPRPLQNAMKRLEAPVTAS